MASSHGRVPTSGAVVIGAISEATRKRLAGLASGRLESSPGAADTVIIREPGREPRALVEELNRIVGGEGVVAPLLQDADGNVLLPNGRVQVRFKGEPSDKALTELAARHQLTLEKRNNWDREQASFRIPASDSRYLPDITNSLERELHVARAWPDVRAAFKREST